MSGIQLEKVTKRFRGGVVAVNEVDLTIEPGEFVVLVGPSGCGKSTLLRMIAGLEPVSSGTISIGGNDVTDDLPQRRDIAMVFQSYALYPRMTVRRNLAFGLRMRRTAKQERDRRVNEVAEILGLEHLLDRRPAALSGGQRQRVAMGRAIVREPQAFLMDEPLSNLDAKLRVSMRAQLTLLHQRLGTTTVYVTHDQIEAMTLGQRVAVLRDGILQQYDTPQRLFRHPANLFVAAFIGSPSMNFTQVTAAGGAVDLAGVRLPAPVPDGPVVLGIRPTAFAPEGRDGWPTLTVTPQVVEDLGDERMVIFELDSPPVDTDAVRAAFDASDNSDLALLGQAKARFTARVPGDVAVTVGEPLVLAVDPSRLYYFDTQSGAAVA